MTDTASLWSGASYERIAETLAPIHDRAVAGLALEPGERVLDVGTGTGAVALRAARAGAEVVGVDISSDQLEKARRAAAEEELEVRFDEGDAQRLPYGDAEFDAVVSVFGAIFAESHTRTADELGRVCRPGGRLALTAWPNDEWSRLGERLGRDYAPGDDAREWGREEYVRELLGPAFDLRFEWGEWVLRGQSAEELWELLASSVPPLKSWFEGLREARQQEVRVAYLDFLAPCEMRRPYLLTLGMRR